MRQIVFISVPFLLLSAASALCFADQSERKQLAQSEPAQQVLDNTFRRLISFTVKITSGSNESSGVVISRDGLILTVAHGIPVHQNSSESSDSSSERNPTIQVKFPDNSVLQARMVALDSDADIALLQSESSEDTRIPETAEISSGSGPTVGDVVLAAGFLGRETSGSAVVRIGNVIAADQERFRSGCMLTSGDSGGPVVDSSGIIVGLNRRIGIDADQNFHIPLKRIQTFLKNRPEYSNRIGWQSPQPTRQLSLQPSGESISAIRERSVRIFQTGENPANSVPTATGTQFPGFVVTKLSQILTAHSSGQEFQCVLPNGDILPGAVVHRNLPLDIAILELQPRSAHVELLTREQKAPESTGSDEISETCREGLIVCSRSDLAAGIVSRCGHTEPGATAEFGATAVTNESNETYLTEVASGSSAADAGLREGDRLMSIENTDIVSADLAVSIAAGMQPGDWLSVVAERNRRLSRYACQLKFPPEMRLMRSEHLDGYNGFVSRRRTGFHGVIQHDTPILPADCGGPLVATNGRLVGINIARRSRESTLAVPVETIHRLLADVKKKYPADRIP